MTLTQRMDEALPQLPAGIDWTKPGTWDAFRKAHTIAMARGYMAASGEHQK